MEKQELEQLLILNRDVIFEPAFFEKLKSCSLLDFRKNINMVQHCKPSLYIEEYVKKYYEDLFNRYDIQSDMFLDYYPLFRCFCEDNYAFLENYRDFNDLIDEEMIVTLEDFRHYGNRIELAFHYLIQMTKLKISEIVVDGLFGDSIYNVWINIKEILRYHENLNDNEKLLDEEKINLYHKILQVDRMDNIDKITMYMDLKDKNIASNFYQDWNLMKQYSYQKIKNSLFYIEEKKKINNQDSVPIYELNREDFYMLISCMNEYSNISHSKRNCYSLISSYHMEVFAKNRFIYGYTDFDPKDIIHVFEKDSCSSDNFDSNSFTTKYVNRIMLPEQISDSYGYSEIQILNKPTKDNCFEVIKPNYLVIFDKIEEIHIKEARRLHIPIVKINTSKYLSKIAVGKKKRNDLGFEKFERVFDSYTNGCELEKEKRLRRRYLLR